MASVPNPIGASAEASSELALALSEFSTNFGDLHPTSVAARQRLAYAYMELGEATAAAECFTDLLVAQMAVKVHHFNINIKINIKTKSLYPEPLTPT